MDNCLNDEVLNDEDEDVLDVDESEILENLDDFIFEEIDELSLWRVLVCIFVFFYVKVEFKIVFNFKNVIIMKEEIFVFYSF